jgi:hypothetical protein
MHYALINALAMFYAIGSRFLTYFCTLKSIEDNFPSLFVASLLSFQKQKFMVPTPK